MNCRIQSFSRMLVLISFSVLIGLQGVVLGEEFVVNDHILTFTEEDRGFYHFWAGSEAPNDWVSPNDYYNGGWEVRFEVLSYPTSNSFIPQMCLWTSIGTETCGPQEGGQGTGVFTVSSTPSNWWNLNGTPVDFSRPDTFDHFGLVMRKGDGCIVSNKVANRGWCWSEREDYFPMKAHLMVVAVSSGSTFSGWENYGVTSVFTGPSLTKHWTEKSGLSIIQNTANFFVLQESDSRSIRLFNLTGQRVGGGTIDPSAFISTGVYLSQY